MRNGRICDGFFVLPEAADRREIIVSPRFCDDGGSAMPFVLCLLTEYEAAPLRRCCLAGAPPDFCTYFIDFVAAAVVVPDLGDVELQAFYGAEGPAALLCQLLLPGEIERLAAAIGDDTEIEDM